MSKRNCFLFDSWFSSKKSADATTSIGVDLIGMVKTNTKEIFKATIEALKRIGLADPT